MALTDDQVKARIAAALKHGGETHTLEDVVEGLQQGRFQIFWNDHGVCITEIVQAPRRKYLNAFIVAGELPGVMDLHNEVEDFARANGCAYMLTTARPGWEKVLPKYGWDKTSVVFTRELGDLELGHG